MKAWLRILGLSVLISVGGPAIGGGDTVPFSSVAFAQATPQGLTKLEDKVNDIANLIRRVLIVFVGLGVVFAGWRFIQGDPHAWRYTLGVVLGATLIFASGEILTWLQS